MNTKTILAVYTMIAGLVTLGLIETVNVSRVTAQEQSDFKIKDFGMKDGTP